MPIPPGSRTAVGGMREKKYRFCLELAALIVDMEQFVFALADVAQQRFNDGVLLAALDKGGLVGVIKARGAVILVLRKAVRAGRRRRRSRRGRS